MKLIRNKSFVKKIKFVFDEELKNHNNLNDKCNGPGCNITRNRKEQKIQ